jgi:hypothetical protein
MSDETVQRWLRILLPRWAQESLAVSMLVGFAISHAYPLFRQTVDPYISRFIDPSAINFWSTAAVSLGIILAFRAGVPFVSRSAALARRIASQVQLVEDVMETMKLSKVDRVAIRRRIAERLAANIDPKHGTKSTIQTVIDAADEEIPGLMNSKNKPKT